MAKHIKREATNTEEDEAYWCENCCNFGTPGMDGMATCALTGTLAWCEEYGGECKGFNVPAANMEEVRRGEWLPYYGLLVDEPFDTTPYRAQTGWKCSLCGKNEIRKELYCNCGAKMDGKEEGNGHKAKENA